VKDSISGLRRSQVILIVRRFSQEFLEFLQASLGLDLISLRQPTDEEVGLVGFRISSLLSHDIQKQYKQRHTIPFKCECVTSGREGFLTLGPSALARCFSEGHRVAGGGII